MIKNKIIIQKGDITELEVDAIVNAANTDLVLGSGVAGAIREKGGYEVQSECNKIGPIKLGKAVITPAGNLKAKYVIHAAAMHLGGRVSFRSLKDATFNSLLIAQKKGIETIAFPAIGTGVGGYSPEKCADVMLKTIIDFLKEKETQIKRVYMVLYDDSSFNVFQRCLEANY